MDGYALRTADVGARLRGLPRLKIVGESAAGRGWNQELLAAKRCAS